MGSGVRHSLNFVFEFVKKNWVFYFHLAPLGWGGGWVGGGEEYRHVKSLFLLIKINVQSEVKIVLNFKLKNPGTFFAENKIAMDSAMTAARSCFSAWRIFKNIISITTCHVAKLRFPVRGDYIIFLCTASHWSTERVDFL